MQILKECENSKLLQRVQTWNVLRFQLAAIQKINSHRWKSMVIFLQLLIDL